MSVLALAGSAPTKNSRNFGADEARAIVAPFPSMVMSLPIAGRPAGPYQSS